MSASLVAVPGGQTITQTSVTGPKDSLFVLIDRLTAQLLALGAGASAAAAQRAHDHQPRCAPRLPRRRRRLPPRRLPERHAAPRPRGGARLDIRARAVGAHRVRWLAPGDHGHEPGPAPRVAVPRPPEPAGPALSVAPARLDAIRSRTPWTVRIADAEHAVQAIPESADAWYYLGDVLFHFGRARGHSRAGGARPAGVRAGVPARFALRRPDPASRRADLRGGRHRRPAALDRSDDRAGLGRRGRPDRAVEPAPGPRDTAGIAAFLAGLERARRGAAGDPVLRSAGQRHDRQSQAARSTPSIASSATKAGADRRGDGPDALPLEPRPPRRSGEVDRYAGDAGPGGAGRAIGASAPTGSAAGRRTPRTWTARAARHWRLWRGDAARRPAAAAALAGPGREGLHGCVLRPRGRHRRGQAGGRSRATRRRHAWSTSPIRLPRPSGRAAWSSLELARLYERQGRVDRALRAVRRRWIPAG